MHFVQAPLHIVRRGHALGFVDAALLAVVERLGEQKLATLDHRHFHVLRPRHTPALALLPEVDAG